MREETFKTAKKELFQELRLGKDNDDAYIIDLYELAWRLKRTNSFCIELEKLKTISEEGNELRIVSKDIWEDQVKNADFVSIESKGDFVKIAAISDFPGETTYLTYIESSDILMREETFKTAKEEFFQKLKQYIIDLYELEWKLERTKLFETELEELKIISEEGNELRIVSKDIWEYQVKNADFVSIELDGDFVKIAAISKFPYKTIYITYIESSDII